MKKVKYVPIEEPDLVSDCCSAALYSQADWHKCAECGEPCSAVPLESPELLKRSK